ncbi:MAG: hypothetical protein ACP5FX_01935, partial [Candidatus Micrarchaeia archaeon]
MRVRKEVVFVFGYWLIFAFIILTLIFIFPKNLGLSSSCTLNSNLSCSNQAFFIQNNKLVLFFNLKNNLNDKITINNFSSTLSNGEIAIGECFPKIVKPNSTTNCKAEFKT